MSVQEEVRLSQALYFQSLDDQNVEGFVGVFAEDAKVLHRGGEIAGRAAITEWIKDLFASRPRNRFTKHISGNMVITVDGNTATSITDVAVFRCDENPWRAQGVTRHHDKYGPQANGRWLITEKRIEPVGVDNP